MKILIFSLSLFLSRARGALDCLWSLKLFLCSKEDIKLNMIKGNINPRLWVDIPWKQINYHPQDNIPWI